MTGILSPNRFTNDSSGYSRGSLTGMVMTVFGSTDKIYTAYYYDIRGRVTRKVQSNLLGGYDVTATTYSFTDKPLTVTYEHTASGKASRTEVYTYSYDEKDRLSKIMHKQGSTTVTLAEYTYDALGRLATKKLHGNNTNTATYSYNIQNWLTGISSTKFTQTLGYGSNYNGNISSMNWNANGASHSYTFTYDGVNRMLNATHGTGAYTEKVTLYDKNGNIKALQRYGNGLIDDLSYTYSGNQLTNVKDESGNTAGFTDGANVANEYTYDNNGNLTKDSNKNISSIEYNSLNLPSVVTFSGGNSITYTYAADGTKLRTAHKMGGVTVTTDYCSNVIYESGAQKRLLTEEGYVDLSVSTPAYYYYLKDHQGNNRVVINSSGTVSETNHYYPFGGVFASTGNVQPYKYNGKELDTKCGLNWYDYGARHYDATLGRWFVVDPLAEKYYAWSPYAYCNNNPIGAVDFEGKLVIFINGFHSGFEGAKSYYWRMKNKPVNFTVAVMAHFEDWQELYYDGSVGGAFNIYSNLIATNRFDAGYVTGMKESNNIISKLARDNNGNIIETIKVITHSMGSAFSKGFLTALMDFILKNPELCNGINIAEYNFAPYQGSLQTAVKGVDTYQYSHKYDKVAGYEIIKGANVMKTKETEEAGHSINDFYDYIKNLPQGRYKIINGQIVKIE